MSFVEDDHENVTIIFPAKTQQEKLFLIIQKFSRDDPEECTLRTLTSMWDVAVDLSPKAQNLLAEHLTRVEDGK